MTGHGVSRLASRILGNAESEENPIKRNYVYVFLYVCLIWESWGGELCLDDSSLSRTSGEAAEHGQYLEVLREPRYDSSDLWTYGLDVDWDENLTTESVSSATVNAALSSTANSSERSAAERSRLSSTDV